MNRALTVAAAAAAVNKLSWQCRAMASQTGNHTVLPMNSALATAAGAAANRLCWQPSKTVLLPPTSWPPGAAANKQVQHMHAGALTPSFLGMTFQIASMKGLSGAVGESSSSNITPTTVAQLPERSGFIAAQAASQE
jgi:hypothetical protein